MPVLEWADWQAAQANLNAANKAVSGMTPAEAQAALNFGQTNLQNGTSLQIVNSQNIPNAGSQVIQFPGTSASQAAGDYVSAGGSLTPGGAASTGASTVQTNNMAMTQTAGGVASVGALLSVNLPTAAAAIAPIAGVALGAGLYSLNPGLWEKISRALLPFCYEDTELLPVVADENGNTYFPKEAIDAVKSVVDANTEIVIQGDPAGISTFTRPWPLNYRSSESFSVRVEIQQWSESLDDYVWTPATISGITMANVPCIFSYDASDTIQGQGSVVFFSTYQLSSIVKCTVAFDNGSLLQYDFQRLRSSSGSVNGRGVFTYSTRVIMRIVNTGDGVAAIGNYPNDWLMRVGYTLLYGSSPELPVGISRWEGTAYPVNPETVGVITSISDDGTVATNPYYPVTMPVGDPGVSPNPNEVPVPGENPEVAPAIDPWITTKPNKETYPEGQPESDPAKIPDPVPGTDPNLDPNANPSQAPEPQPQPDPDPAQSTKPNNSGTSPLPVIPIIPTLPSAASGLLHVYNPTQSQIDAFGSWLWTTFSGDLIDTISKLFNDPMDAVIGLHELYATPAVSGSSTIRAGFLDSGVSSNLVGSRYTTINCGSIVVQEYYQNYLDYSPYTKCYIYLPFVGIVPVLADDIIGNAVNVTYHVDSYTGCCIAVVTVARSGYSSTVYQFEGNCAVEVPITSGYQSTLMGALIGVGTAALTGNPHAGIAAANMGRASLGKNDVSHSGSFGSSYGAMGAKVPYIIVKRPTQKSVVNYNQDYGFPAHKRVTIGACSGYLRAREVHVISPTATDDEKARIEELLKQGVFVK